MLADLVGHGTTFVAAQGGRITLDTSPGRGCVFHVLLPLPAPSDG
ncbi:hypothetical protein GCM10009639_28740 [Kitasatospora putterlickiae]|uniref:Histidine kinase/HSP90-like ATPase domain-containing protein n=1 Tax=Kitasatospora putterlickiae TaxID=221725 RepID=A0ABN1Y0F0_9ACTN